MNWEVNEFIKINLLNFKDISFEEESNEIIKLLDDKIDVTAFMVWFVENYPQSKKIVTENSKKEYEYQ